MPPGGYQYLPGGIFTFVFLTTGLVKCLPHPLKPTLKLTVKSLHQLSLDLIQAGQFMFPRGWVPATSGNFSARVDSRQIAITVSGKHKGQLTPADIMTIDYQGHSLDGKKPSAETLLHTQIYRLCPKVNCVLHPHSIHATVAGRLFNDAIILENYELLKALEGVETHETRIVIPIFPNTQHIPELARSVEDYLLHNPDCKGYVIGGHGFYTWGSTVATALRHVEALEFLFESEIRLLGASK